MIYAIKLFDEDLKYCGNIGYYFDKATTIEAVENNVFDIYENAYTYAVVMAIREGLYNVGEEEFWYKWNKEKKCYESCNKPPQLKAYVYGI